MKFLVQFVMGVGLVYSLSGCSTSQPALNGVQGNGVCNNPKCQCPKPCQCGSSCKCGMNGNADNLNGK